MRGLGRDPQDALAIGSCRAQSAPLEQLLRLVDVGDGESERGQAVGGAGRCGGEFEPHVGELDRSPRRVVAGIDPVGAPAEQHLVVCHGCFERGDRNDDVIERVDHVVVCRLSLASGQRSLETVAIPWLGQGCARYPAIRGRRSQPHRLTPVAPAYACRNLRVRATNSSSRS